MQEAFERGSVDVFQYKLRQLGRLTQLNVMHDNSDSNPGWLLLKVVVTSNMPGEKVQNRMLPWDALHVRLHHAGLHMMLCMVDHSGQLSAL